jgi:Na+-translocating ferredoxin:NAD+ oxidoreductase RnfA subunit
MNEISLGRIFIDACLVNNFVLAYFLGICPFLGVFPASSPRPPAWAGPSSS